jgi:hypothetical protein
VQVDEIDDLRRKIELYERLLWGVSDGRARQAIEKMIEEMRARLEVIEKQ